MADELAKKKQIRKIMRKRRKNTISFRYNVKLAKLPEKKNWGSWLSNMFGGKGGSTLKDLA